jgi:hypothetical protein
MRCADHRRIGALLAVVGMGLFGLMQARAENEVASEQPRLVLLAPGTQVDGTLPSNWSDRVIRSVPRLASGKTATLPSSAKGSATLFRTTILADVVRRREGYRLRAIGVGNAVPFGGREVVVTPDGPDDARGTLSTIEKIVCQRAYDELARLVVRGRHEEVDLYYGILVDPDTGALRTLNWATLPGKPRPPSRITLLPPDDTFDCGLDVRVTRTVGPWSVAWSFAMASLPAGKAIPVTPDAARLIEKNADGKGDSIVVEKALRGLMASPTRR